MLGRGWGVGGLEANFTRPQPPADFLVKYRAKYPIF
jgi:hypothetical protein